MNPFKKIWDAINDLREEIETIRQKHNVHVREFDEPRPNGYGGSHREMRKKIDKAEAENAALRERVDGLTRDIFARQGLRERVEKLEAQTAPLMFDPVLEAKYGYKIPKDFLKSVNKATKPKKKGRRK